MTKIAEMSFFKKIITSIKDFERYAELAMQKLIDTLKYLIKLIVIFTLIIVSISTYKILNMLNDTKQFIKEEIPEFSFEEDVLNIDIEEPIILQKDNLLFQTLIIDQKEIDDEKLQLYKEKLSNSESGILLLKNKVIILANSQLDFIECSYKSLLTEGTSLSKEDILNYFSGASLVSILAGVFIINLLYSFMMYFIGVLMYIVLLTVLGYFTATIMKMRIRFSAIFNMSIHAFTLPTILFLIYIIVNMFTGFEIIYFDVMYIGVAYIYIITAILMIKSDLIKRQQELVKIVEEQQKISEENTEENTGDEKEEEKKDEAPDDKEKDNLEGTDPEPQGNMFNEK